MLQLLDPPVEYLLAPHVVQLVAPTVAEYVPASHWTQLPSLLCLYPGLHRQLDSRVLPSGELELERQAIQVDDEVAPTVEEYVLAPHVVQLVAPVLSEYVPAIHDVQVLPLRYLPAGHLASSLLQ